MSHISNLFHVTYFLIAAWLVLRFTRRSQARIVTVIIRLIQLVLVLFVIDLLFGYFLINPIYGSTPSAGWISKAIIAFPALLLLSTGVLLVRRFKRRKS